MHFFADCPNGFVHLNNKCYKWQTPNQIDVHLKYCHMSRGQILEVSPSNPTNELVAKTMMALFGSDLLYAGKFTIWQSLARSYLFLLNLFYILLIYIMDVMDRASACLKSVLRIGVDKDHRTMIWELILYQACTTIEMNWRLEFKIVYV